MARLVMRTSIDAVVFQEEQLSTCSDEYFAFIHEYWDGAPENEGEPSFDFNTELYETMDKLGTLRLLVGRHYGKMVAVALYIVIKSPKYRTMVVGQCDTFAVAREWRGHGLGGMMLQHVVKMMQIHGVHSILNGYREVFGDIVPLFEKYGFELYERFYHLVIPDLESTKIAEGEG